MFKETSQKVVYNGNVLNIDDSALLFKPEITIYEVVRLENSKVLFFDDHFARFENSVLKTEIDYGISKEEVVKQLALLVKLNYVSNGNIKFEVSKTTNGFSFLAQFIPHSYPSSEMYKSGVSVCTFEAFRPNPAAKILHSTLKEDANRIIQQTNSYEALMIHPDGYFTEGSRSNVFFIRNNQVLSAPSADILEGITYKYVLKICKQEKLDLVHTRIQKDELQTIEAAFISGTSPKILPISNIDSFSLDINNKILRFIIGKYNSEIDQYLAKTQALI